MRSAPTSAHAHTPSSPPPSSRHRRQAGSTSTATCSGSRPTSTSSARWWAPAPRCWCWLLPSLASPCWAPTTPTTAALCSRPASCSTHSRPVGRAPGRRGRGGAGGARACACRVREEAQPLAVFPPPPHGCKRQAGQPAACYAAVGTFGPALRLVYLLALAARRHRRLRVGLPIQDHGRHQLGAQRAHHRLPLLRPAAGHVLLPQHRGHLLRGEPSSDYSLSFLDTS